MMRYISPELQEALDRPNPYVEFIPELSLPDCSQVLRRAADQFFNAPYLVSEDPAASAAADGAGRLVLASTGQEIWANINQDSEEHISLGENPLLMRALGWQPTRSFTGGVLRTFKAKVKQSNSGLNFINSWPAQLRIFRATGTPGFRVNHDTGTQRAFTQWTFTDLMPEPLIVHSAAITWVSDIATLNFDLRPFSIQVLPSSGVTRDPNSPETLDVYYFEVRFPNDHATDQHSWFIDNTSVHDDATYGTFRRRVWQRSSDDDASQWTETIHTDAYTAHIELESYVPSSTRIYLLDMGKVPEAGSTGRIVYERATPMGTTATLEISSSGSSGPWTAVVDGDAVAARQQTYHLRETMLADTAARLTPAVSAMGLEWRSTREVGVESTVTPLSHESAPPFFEGAIGQGKLTIVRTGARDYDDIATFLGSTQSTPKLELDLYLGSRHPQIPRETWLRVDRSAISQRVPGLTSEAYTHLSYTKRFKSKVPARAESINTVHTVVSSSTSAVVVTPALSGASTSGNEYDGKGYYLKVRTSAGDLPVGWIQVIDGNTGTTQMDFTTTGLPFALVAGDVVEVHSGVYIQPALTYKDWDLADVWWDLITVQNGTPPERVGLAGVGTIQRGGFPPRVTDIAPGDTDTQAKLLATNRFDDQTATNELIDHVSAALGGMTTEVAGQIVYRQIYPLRDALGNVTVSPDPVAAVFDPRDYYGLDPQTGVEGRITVMSCGYGVDKTASTTDSAPASQVTYVDDDALAWLTEQDLDEAGASEVSDDIAAWCYNSADGGLFLATSIAGRIVRACSTGMRVWPFNSVLLRPELMIGDRVVIITDAYTDYDPAGKREIKGWYAYTLVIVSTDQQRSFRGFMLGLSNAQALVGGPGTQAGPNAPIVPPVLTLSTVQASGGSGGARRIDIRSSFQRPETPFWVQMSYGVRYKEPGGDYGAQMLIQGSATGPDLIHATFGLWFEITPISISSGGTKTLGDPQEILVPGISNVHPNITVTAAADFITYAIAYDTDTQSIEVWSVQQGTDPGDASQENIGTLVTTLKRGDGRTTLQLAVDGTDPWRGTTFIPYDDSANRGDVETFNTQRDTGASVPPDLVSASGHATTSSSVTNRVVLAGGHTAGMQIQSYKDGVSYGSLYLITSGDVSAGYADVVSTGLSAGTNGWTYEAWDSGVPSAGKTTSFNVTIAAGGVLDAPTISSGGRDPSDPCVSVFLHVTAGANNPSGTTYTLYHGATNMGAVVVGTNSIPIGASSSSGWIVKASKSTGGWTTSAASSSVTFPAKTPGAAC